MRTNDRTGKAILLAGLALAGCAHRRPEIAADRACPLTMYDLSVSPTEPATVAAAATAGDTDLEQLRRKVGEALVGTGGTGGTAEATGGAPVPAEALVLSGGGKWGAFGAGFLHELARAGVPAYRVVTGISTGALQASFMFVGQHPVPVADRARRYDNPATDTALRDDEPLPGAGRRYVDDLPLAYTVTRSETVLDSYVTNRSGTFNQIRDGLTILHKGTGANLRGLRTRLETLIDEGMMQRIAEGAEAKRLLLVGIVDLDDGRPYAVDMTALALEWAETRAVAGPAAAARAKLLHGCYHDVLMASSSEPMVALPVFIAAKRNAAPGPDGRPFSVRMYIDGGMRTGVFLEKVLTPEVLADAAETGTAARRFVTTVVINGQLTSADKTRRRLADGSFDDDWFKQWSFVPLALRAKEILVDQIYRFSADRVAGMAERYGETRLVTAADYGKTSFAWQGRVQSCPQWQDEESRLGFPPTFMRCLIAHGRATARGEDGRPRWTAIRSPERAALAQSLFDAAAEAVRLGGGRFGPAAALRVQSLADSDADALIQQAVAASPAEAESAYASLGRRLVAAAGVESATVARDAEAPFAPSRPINGATVAAAVAALPCGRLICK